ncbi:MAG: helix-turn-helix domain-containing protein [Candidatus Gastranaerophilales bacterium]|nr:helix-turn-helix domain-containing protein [Candidatus Gastranaerophilales bacterium]
MQQSCEQIEKFNKVIGEIIIELRKKNNNISINNFCRQFDFDRGNFSKIERGKLSCRLITIYKVCEAFNIKFSDFAKILEEKLGENFNLIDFE